MVRSILDHCHLAEVVECVIILDIVVIRFSSTL